jgi:hypothetical protein
MEQLSGNLLFNKTLLTQVQLKKHRKVIIKAGKRKSRKLNKKKLKLIQKLKNLKKKMRKKVKKKKQGTKKKNLKTVTVWTMMIMMDPKFILIPMTPFLIKRHNRKKKIKLSKCWTHNKDLLITRKI